MDHLLNHGMCRCCASEGMFKNYNATYQWMGADEVYSDMLKECFDITLETLEDWNNGGICEVCITQLRNASNFKKQVLQTEETFKKKVHEKVFEDNIVKVEVAPDDDDIESDNNLSEGFSGTDFEVPVKVETEEPKPKKRAAAKASTSRAKKAKTDDGEPSAKRVGGDKPDLSVLKSKIKNLIQVPKAKKKVKPDVSDDWKITIIKKKGDKTGTKVEADKLRLAFRKKQNAEVKELDKHLHNIRTILCHSNATPIRTHNGIGYVCGFCDKYFEKPADLKSHSVETHDEAEKAKYLVAAHLEAYIVKIDVTHLRCTVCDASVEGLEKLMTHLRTDHQKTLYTDIKNHILPFKFESDNLTCIMCAENFDYFKQLLGHMNIHYRNFECEECQAPFVTQRKLRTHAQLHKTGRFKCSSCPKVFLTRTYVLNHEKLVHAKVTMRNKCPYCTEKFSCYRQKRNHMETVHGVQPLVTKCLACDKTFKCKSKLAIHTRRDHLMERDFKCDLCDMKFFSKREVMRHKLKHTGERQYTCQVCLKSYVRKTTLREHMRIHDDDRRFKCEHCGMAFVQKCSWKSHMRSRHSELLEPVETSLSPSFY